MANFKMLYFMQPWIVLYCSENISYCHRHVSHSSIACSLADCLTLLHTSHWHHRLLSLPCTANILHFMVSRILIWFLGSYKSAEMTCVITHLRNRTNYSSSVHCLNQRQIMLLVSEWLITIIGSWVCLVDHYAWRWVKFGHSELTVCC